MSAKFKIGKSEWDVASGGCEALRDMDKLFRPTTPPKLPPTTFTVISTNSKELANWLIAKDTLKDGSYIEIDDNTKTTKHTITFKAHLVEWSYSFFSGSSSETVKISFSEFSFDGIRFVNNWPKS